MKTLVLCQYCVLVMHNKSKAFKNNAHDNQAVLKQIAVLRHERAVLLGYKSHADFVLEERMAESPTKVFSFLENL